MATIQLNATTQAFYAGVAKAEEVKAEVAKMARHGYAFDARSDQFWLQVGMHAASYATQDELDAFVAGVGIRAPQRSGVFVEFSTESPQFHRLDESEDEDAIDQDMRTQVSRILVRIAGEIIGGSDQGQVVDDISRVIGRYFIND